MPDGKSLALAELHKAIIPMRGHLSQQGLNLVFLNDLSFVLKQRKIHLISFLPEKIITVLYICQQQSFGPFVAASRDSAGTQLSQFCACLWTDVTSGRNSGVGGGYFAVKT